MAQYQSFEKNIEVGGNEISIIALGSLSSNQRQTIIEKHSIDTNTGSWNNLQDLLNALKDISDIIGDMNLFTIGKMTVENATFPPMDGLEMALRSIDVAYHMNHKKDGQTMFNPATGQMVEGIGHYTLKSFDQISKKAVMICHTPYPSKFEEGLILQIVRKFKPEGSIRQRVSLDTDKETRLSGGDTCTFNISW